MMSRRSKVYIDDWILLEKMALINGIDQFGDDWQKIAEYMKPLFKDYLRPNDWFTADTCEAQYDILVEKYVDKNDPEPWLDQVVEHIKALCREEAVDPKRKEIEQKYKKVTNRLKKLQEKSISFPKYLEYGKIVNEIMDEQKQKRIKHIESLKKRQKLKKEFEEKLIKEEELTAGSPRSTHDSESLDVKSTTMHSVNPGDIESGLEFMAELHEDPISKASNEVNSIKKELEYEQVEVSTEGDLGYQEDESLLDDAILQEDLAEVIENISNVNGNFLDKIIEGLEGHGEELSQKTADEVNLPNEDIPILNTEVGYANAPSSPSSQIVKKFLNGVECSSGALNSIDTTEESENSQSLVGEDTYIEEVDENVVSETSDVELDDFIFMDDDFTVSDDADNTRFTKSCTVSENHPEIFDKESKYSETEKFKEHTKAMVARYTNENIVHPNSCEVYGIDNDFENSDYGDDLSKLKFIGFDNKERDVTPSMFIKNVGNSHPNFMAENEVESREMNPADILDPWQDVPAGLSKDGIPDKDIFEISNNSNAVDDTCISLINDSELEVFTKGSYNSSNEKIGSTEEEINIEFDKVEAVAFPTSNLGLNIAVKEEPIEVADEESEPNSLSQEINADENLISINTPFSNDCETDTLRYVNVRTYPAAKGKRPSMTPNNSKLSGDPSVSSSEEDIRPINIIDTTPPIKQISINLSETHYVGNFTIDSLMVELVMDNTAYKIPYVRDAFEVTNQLSLPEKINVQVERRKKKSNVSSGLDCKSLKSSKNVQVLDNMEITKRPKRFVLNFEQRKSLTVDPLLQSFGRRTYDSINKMIILAYNHIQAQKYSNIFQRPITNEQAPDYEDVILKPMDLQTLRRLISEHEVDTITKFQYYALLMLNNAMMYNGINSDIGHMAREVAEAIVSQMQYAVEVMEQGVYDPNTKSDQISKRTTRQSSKIPRPARNSM